MKKFQIIRDPPNCDDLIELYKKERNIKLKEKNTQIYDNDD